MFVDKVKHELITSLILLLDLRVFEIGSVHRISLQSNLARQQHTPGAHPSVKLSAESLNMLRHCRSFVERGHIGGMLVLTCQHHHWDCYLLSVRT